MRIKNTKSNLEGLKFGTLTVSNESERRPKGKASAWYWKCLCECFRTTWVRTDHLTSGRTKSCSYKHTSITKCVELSKRFRSLYPREHCSWRSMWARVTNKKHPNYDRYGGRGITVTTSWKNFEVFLKDMGKRPENTFLNRKDQNGDYCKANCAWRTSQEQHNNKRSNRVLEYKGQKLNVTQWARRLNVDRMAIYDALYRGFSTDRAISYAQKRAASKNRA